MSLPVPSIATRLGAAYFFLFIAVGAWAPFAGPWLASLGFDATAIGLLLGIGAATKLVAPTLWGWLADASGAHTRLVRWTTLATAFCALLLWLTPPRLAPIAAVIAAMMFCWNAGNPQLEVITLRMLGLAGHRYGLVRLWGSLGFLLAVLACGAWFEREGLTAFAPILATALAATFLVSWWIPELPARENPTGPDSFGGALRAPSVVPLFATLFLMQFGFGPYYGFFSLYLAELGFGTTAVGALWALGVVAEIVAFALLPGLLPRVAPLGLLQLSCALTALRWLVVALAADKMPLLVAAQLLHFASFAVYHAVAVQLVQQAFPGRYAGRGQALHSTIAYGAGGACGVMASGWCWDRFGPASPFLLGAAAATGAWVCAVWLGRRYPQRSETT